MATMKLILYIGDTCRYCQRVLDYLSKNPMTIEIKDVWHDDKAFQEMKALTQRTQVPCLRMGDNFMHESLDIIEKLKELHEKTA
jgi:glutaredoxin